MDHPHASSQWLEKLSDSMESVVYIQMLTFLPLRTHLHLDLVKGLLGFGHRVLARLPREAQSIE